MSREKLQEYIDKNTNDTGVIMLTMGGITSLDGIKFPEKTTYIYLPSSPIASLDGVVFPPNLRTMQIIMNKITSLDGVVFPPKITNLQLQGNQITSLDRVEFPSKLPDIQLQDNQITSLYGVVFPPGLVSLNLSNNKITSFAGMQFPLSLLNLKLDGNPIDVETVSQLKNPSPFVIREIVAAFPETAQHFKRMDEMKEQQFEQLRRMMSQLRPMIEEREQTVPAFSATTEQGETHTIPFIPEKTVQWAIDYLNDGPLSGKCGKMTLFYNSTPLDPVKPLADSGIAENSTIFIQCHDERKGGRKKRINKTRRYGRAHRQKSAKNM
jgi:hypothetical protein